MSHRRRWKEYIIITLIPKCILLDRYVTDNRGKYQSGFVLLTEIERL
jgi:hypothetical protein